MPATEDAPIGDAERDATVTLLHAHMAAGHIDRTQLNERLVWVRSATTQNELDAVTEHLPQLPANAIAAAEGRDTRPPWRRVMLWMIALTPALFLLIFIGWSFWWVFFVVWAGLFVLVYRADRTAEAKATQ